MSEEEAERRAWATVNATHHGGEKPAVVVTANLKTKSLPEKEDERGSR